MTRKGRHKIFVGMISGVGKTYRMLDEAQRLKQQGTDVVIGLLEAHNRRDTVAKAEGLEIVPRKAIAQRSLILHEMDTESILARQPQLVLIDDLAHTNFPGSYYESRYQDIEVLLAAGINVYSTVNIQHLVSLNQAMAKIPGIVVKNQIPDRLLDEANEVVVVDVTPETLQGRLRDGKLCSTEHIGQSLQTMFQRENLITLRELALRQIANNIEGVRIREGDRLDKNIVSGTRTCCVHERVLVWVTTQPHSIQLIKRGAQLADSMNASLHGLFVQNPEHLLTQSETLYINTCEQLCQDFGGEFLQIYSCDTPGTIAHVAKARHITQVMLGKTYQAPWKTIFHRPVVDRLISLLADRSDLHIISTDP